MKRLLIATLLAATLFVGAAQAAVKFQATNALGEYINLTDEKADVCRPFEYRVVIHSTDKIKPGTFQGCWTMMDQIVYITLDDGTKLAFSPEIFQKVTEA